MIQIIYQGPVPEGMAATNRLLSYAQGLATSRHDVRMIVPCPTENRGAVVNVQRHGSSGGVRFEYCITNVKPKRKAIRGLLGVACYIKTFAIVRPNTILILHAADKASLLLGIILASAKNSRIVWTRDEKPVILKSRIWRFLINRYFRGFIFMTEAIKQFALEYLDDNKLIYILPITIDCHRFTSPSYCHPSGPYFCYVGLSNPKRDGFEQIIQGYLKYRAEFSSNAKLVCLGNNRSADLTQILARYRNAKHFSDIEFVGIKRRSEVALFVSNSLGNVTTPKSIDSLGFPSKIAEYLASGKPLITTDAGEISRYLSGETCYLCRRGNIRDIAESFHRIVVDPVGAARIAENGLALAKNRFNYTAYKSEIDEFLANIDQ